MLLSTNDKDNSGHQQLEKTKQLVLLIKTPVASGLEGQIQITTVLNFLQQLARLVEAGKSGIHLTRRIEGHTHKNHYFKHYSLVAWTSETEEGGSLNTGLLKWH